MSRERDSRYAGTVLAAMTGETPTGKIDRFEREIMLQGDLNEEQRQRLLEIADRCPVHKTLHGEVRGCYMSSHLSKLEMLHKRFKVLVREK